MRHMFDRHLKRGLAIFFLALAIADLSVPGFCKSDDWIVNMSGRARPALWPDCSAAPVPLSTDHKLPKEDDCFCCCRHILPGHAPSLFILDLKEAKPTLPLTQPRAPSLPSVYHPPRASSSI